MRTMTRIVTAIVGMALVTGVWSQVQVLRDLADKNPRRLSKEELTQLLPGAKVSRVSERGNTSRWTNSPGGDMIVSNDNRGESIGNGRASSTPGHWQISDDGRYCVTIEWKRVPTEQWCRLILQTSDGYYGVLSDGVGTERVHKLDIEK